MCQLLLIYLSCCCLLLVAATTELPEDVATTDASFGYPDEGITLQELGKPSPEEEQLMASLKVNWLPMALGADPDKELTRQVDEVSKQHEADENVEEEDEVEEEEEEDMLESAPRDGNVCPITAEKGLTRLIRNARPLLDLPRLSNILANAREDGKVSDLFRLLRSDQFKERVRQLRNTKEQGALRDYVCQSLKLNHTYYIEYVRLLINVQNTEPVTSPLPNRRRGVRGLLQDLRDALPRAQLRDLYRRQLVEDRELATAVRRIRSLKFRLLLANVRALPEYRVVRNDLELAGVPLQLLLNLVSNALGWGSLDVGTETEILSGLA
ncbi:uncharacterized protein LOC6562660 [Drosophila grimshawi]|uniref:GH10809 n=1 Tax=Drosophila grimshawi TaxID=7222 RepID=B4JAZ4_DROGR|nr:uncharacterized protein LOC6562660 [Drosophila grimshawi]EDW02864.1 GH10809 [Drosophila grimshawi]